MPRSTEYVLVEVALTQKEYDTLKRDVFLHVTPTVGAVIRRRLFGDSQEQPRFLKGDLRRGVAQLVREVWRLDWHTPLRKDGDESQEG